MEETHYLGDIKDVTLPDEISKILTGELQEVFPYIKDVKLEGTMKYLHSTPFVRKLVWKPKKVTLTLYIDKSFEEVQKKYGIKTDKPDGKFQITIGFVDILFSMSSV